MLSISAWIHFFNPLTEVCDQTWRMPSVSQAVFADRNLRDRKLIKKSHAWGQLRFQEEGKHNFLKTVSTGHCLKGAV